MRTIVQARTTKDERRIELRRVEGSTAAYPFNRPYEVAAGWMDGNAMVDDGASVFDTRDEALECYDAIVSML
jgi:hypothetical protein